MEKDKLLNIIKLCSKFNVDNFTYELTIDYEEIIKKYHNKKFNLHELLEIIKPIEIKEGFNFTLHFENNKKQYTDAINGENEKTNIEYFNSGYLVFHSHGMGFYFFSPHLSKYDNNVYKIDVNKIFKILDVYINTSKVLYDINIKLN